MKKILKSFIACGMALIFAVLSLVYIVPLDSFASDTDIISPAGTTYKVITSDDVYTNSEYYKSAPKTLGIVNGFHLTAFDTATLKSHTNGNIMANSIDGSTNFGTNDITSEVSYIRNIKNMNSTAGSNKASVLAIESGIAFTVVNNAERMLDGKQLASPSNVIQDSDSVKYIDFTTAKAQATQMSNAISLCKDNTSIANAGGVPATYDFTDMNQKYIQVQSEKLNILNISLNDILENNNIIRVKGFNVSETANTAHTTETAILDINTTLVVNVDMKGATQKTFYPSVRYSTSNGSDVANAERIEWSVGKILWNIIDTSETDGIYKGELTFDGPMFGTILAPEATIIMNQNLDGSIIANNLTIAAESHRCDFTGNLVNINVNFQKK